MYNWDGGVLKTPYIRIQITNRHIHAIGIWVMHVRELDWHTRDIGVSNDATIEEARTAAVENVRDHLNRMMESLDGL